MNISDATARLVSTLNGFSGNRLSRREDLAVLLELATTENLPDDFERLCFLAKFVTNAARVMQRIGREGEGYEKMAGEFSRSVEEASQLIQSLLKDAPAEEQQRFRTSYFALNSRSLEGLLGLLHDLSWYKNWKIDNRGKGATGKA